MDGWSVGLEAHRGSFGREHTIFLLPKAAKWECVALLGLSPLDKLEPEEPGWRQGWPVLPLSQAQANHGGCSLHFTTF